MPPAPRQRGFQADRAIRGNKDLATVINESAAVLDEQILDPEGPLAVQIPEGVGADGSENVAALRSVYEVGTVEQQFERGSANMPVHSDPDSLDEEDRKHVRAAGEAQEDEGTDDPFALAVETPVHSIPAVRREAEAQDAPVVEEAQGEKDKPNVPERALDASEEPKKPSELKEDDKTDEVAEKSATNPKADKKK
jgi:hypothetical protein